ncbi:MAG: ComEC/Rec2 family competence protein [Patescibacteria group bacterium]|nr:ComEC family competence protein [Patescibacteria group bacterium]
MTGKKFWLIAGNLCFMAGILAGKYVVFGLRAIALAGVFTAGIWFLFSGKNYLGPKLVLAGFVFLFGIYWAGRFLVDCPGGVICNLFGSEVSGRGKIMNCKKKNENLRLEVGDLEIGGKEYKGKLLINLFKYQGEEFLNLGDEISFQGKVQEPENFSEFDYKGYLRKQGVWAILDDARMGKALGGRIAVERMSFWQKFGRSILGVRQGIFMTIGRLWSGPERGLIQALLTGDKSEIDQKTQDNFRLAGVSHLVAISGMHIAIIADLIFMLVFSLGFPRKAAFVFCGGIVFCFVVLVGAPVSAIRAFIMAGLGFLAKICGRKIWMNNLLCFSASVIVFYNPLVVWHDAGFWLSFSAVWGLVNLGSVFYKKLGWVPDNLGLRKTAAASLAAQAATAVFSIYYFGYFSLVAVLANILVFQAVFYVIFLGGAAILTQALGLPLAGFFAFWAKWVSRYMIGVSNWFGSRAWAGIEFGI